MPREGSTRMWSVECRVPSIIIIGLLIKMPGPLNLNHVLGPIFGEQKYS